MINLINYLKKILTQRSPKISIEINNLEPKIKKYLNQKVGICFDTGNVLTESKHSLKNIFEFKDQINHFHIKDKKKINKRYVNCSLGEGIVDFKSFFFILELIKYKGAITFETSFGNNSIKNAKNNLKFIKKVIFNNKLFKYK